MTRKLLTAFLLAVSVAASAQNTERFDIVLSKDSPKDTITMPQKCNIFLNMSDMDFAGAARVRVEIENLCDEQQYLLIFNRTYKERELKKLNFGSVLFDRFFPYDQYRYNLEVCRNLSSPMMIYPESGRQFLLDINATDHGETSQRIPIYVAQKKKKKFLLSDIFFVDLRIKVDLKPDVEYLNLERRVEELLERSNRSYCPNPNHKPRNEAERYQRDIEECKKEIDNILMRKNYPPTSKAAQPYIQLREFLRNVVVDVKDCGRHNVKPDPQPNKPNPKPVSQHSCLYCQYNKKALKNMLIMERNEAIKNRIRKCAKSRGISL